MRLINVETLQIEEFTSDIPLYVILSHTWGNDNEEVSFQDMQSQDRSNLESRNGYTKIRNTCAITRVYGFGYAWVDTCCIDKRSSAELSEAINSMFKWYKEASECFVYLADVEKRDNNRFQSSRWFTRGWTLQELLAPSSLHFFDVGWQYLGDGTSKMDEVSKATGIATHYLEGTRSIHDASISERMSWASNRQTKREEDVAYCLLGIFDVNMPMLYGEGQKAFVRLQEEILKTSNDQTLFAWTLPNDTIWERPKGIFAEHPLYFSDSGSYIPDNLGTSPGSSSLTNNGLQIQLLVPDHSESGSMGVLAGRRINDFENLLAIPLVRGEGRARYRRAGYGIAFIARDQVYATCTMQTVHIAQHLGSFDLYTSGGLTTGAAAAIGKISPYLYLRQLPPELSISEVYPSSARKPHDQERLIATEHTSHLGHNSGQERNCVVYLAYKNRKDFSFVLAFTITTSDWNTAIRSSLVNLQKVAKNERPRSGHAWDVEWEADGLCAAVSGPRVLNDPRERLIVVPVDIKWSSSAAVDRPHLDGEAN